jgi:hypothetical protein
LSVDDTFISRSTKRSDLCRWRNFSVEGGLAQRNPPIGGPRGRAMADYASPICPTSFKQGRFRSVCPTGNSRVRAMRKLPVVPICRSGHIPIFGKRLDADPKSEASSAASRLARRGAFRPIVTIRGARDAVDARTARAIPSCGRTLLLRTAKSCGPDTPTLVSSSQAMMLAGDGGKKARSPGRARYKR